LHRELKCRPGLLAGEGRGDVTSRPEMFVATAGECSRSTFYRGSMASLISLLAIAIATHARGDRHMAQKKPTVYEFIPKLGQLRDDVLFGDVWEHPDLSKRDRSLVTVAVLAALYRTDEMRGHMQRALDNGVTETELKGLITHVAFYAGWPCAVNAGRVAIDVFGPK
jgi:4-carboxymuconolactone decarboxylase